MTTAEILLQDYDIEIANTRRTLERLPDGKDFADWTPHPKSMPWGKLAMHCATLPVFGYYVMEDPGMDMATSTRPRIPLIFESREACLGHLDELGGKARGALAAAPDEYLAAPWRFSFGEHVISNGARSLAFRQMFFDHMIHHVAQLGVYLRMNGIPVPALYGPSADEPWVPTP